MAGPIPGGARGSTVSLETDVTDWVRSTKGRLLAVFRESVQRTVEDMQTPVGAGGNMPVDTGFLRASLRMSVNAPVPLDPKARPQDGKTYGYVPDAVVVAIAGAELGDKLFASYTASYALAVHYGWAASEAVPASEGQAAKPARKARAGRQWVTMAAQKWPQTVAAVCAEIQQRAEAPKPAAPTAEL